ncbi:hypothetical protein GXW71_27755 [Roseomonas hellenica]|uniref:Uncharacterized protein n=1 Tax=Plastoroseomonas hellenica TaxID=2687306 RepID=A0ABS5F6I3_9PROT|nr:hypothetical protein [Plastoroseomonas hellenica]MBR0668181.1 hypothetical protein [Plastoroseomonas hellenica]
MKMLIASALIALPGLAWSQDTDSVVRRVIDMQLMTRDTQPPGPGVPGSEASRLLGRAQGQAGQTPGGAVAPFGMAPASSGATPASSGSPFSAPASGIGGR